MPDVFSKSKRSEVMAAIKSKGNKDTEVRLAAILREAGIKGWRRHLPITGRPDFVFRNARVALFVDGCFWHGCPRHGRKPGTNQTYWLKKMACNKARDRKVTRELRRGGWFVLRIWEHQLQCPEKVTACVAAAIERRTK